MQVGFLDLTLWSFLMATAHGAGLMVMPVLLELPAGAAASIGAHGAHMSAFAGSLWTGLLAVTVHTLAMLVAAGAIAWVIFAWVGLAVLRRAWINLDLLWSAMLIGTGVVFLVLAGLDLAAGRCRAPSWALTAGCSALTASDRRDVDQSWASRRFCFISAGEDARPVHGDP